MGRGGRLKIVLVLVEGGVEGRLFPVEGLWAMGLLFILLSFSHIQNFPTCQLELRPSNKPL
jgi:hypothetical protein